MDFGIFLLFGLLAIVLLGLFVVGFFLIGPRFASFRKVWTVSVVATCLGLFLVGMGIRRIDLDESLWSAAADGNLPEVKRLIQSGADPNAKWEGGASVIEVARANRQRAVMDYLESIGAK